jgi:hypothetical protein
LFQRNFPANFPLKDIYHHLVISDISFVPWRWCDVWGPTQRQLHPTLGSAGVTLW